jgi:hypothetical protein
MVHGTAEARARTTLREMVHGRCPRRLRPRPRRRRHRRRRVAARYMSGPRSYGAIEFSSPRRRTLNIHTVGRVLPHSPPLLPPPPALYPPRALSRARRLHVRRIIADLRRHPLLPAEFKPMRGLHDRPRGCSEIEYSEAAGAETTSLRC